MVSIGSRKIFSTLILVLGSIVLLFILSNLYFTRTTTEHYENLYLDQQHLQMRLSAAAIQENIRSSLSETKILADYSFVEFEQGLRTVQSIENLLHIEQSIYNTVVLYAYYRSPQEPHFLQTVDGSKGAAAKSAAEELVNGHWETFRSQFIDQQQSSPYVLPLYADRAAQLASFMYPVVVNGEFQGALYISIDMGSFAKRYFEPYVADDDCSFYITDSQGRVIWCPTLKNLNQPAGQVFSFFPDKDQLPEGNSFVTTPQGRYLAAWSSVAIADTEIRLIMATPEKSIISMPLQIGIWRIAINVLLLIGAGLSLLYTFRLYRAHQHNLLQVQQQSDLQEEIAEKNRLLQRATNRYSLLFENANDGIFILENMKIIQCNTRASQLFNYSKTELIGKSPIDLSPAVQPEGTTSIEKAKYYSRRCLSGIPQIFEWRHFDSHGTEFTAEVSLSAIKIENETLFQSFIRDITARKRIEENLQHALKEREVMLQEIHHRVKNNLQIIDSILSLQRSYAGKNDQSRVIPQTRRRIAAMAEAHETMYRQQDFNTVSMNEFLLHLISQIEGTFIGTNKRVQPRIEALGLPLEKGLLVGFITSELVENAFLHANPRDEKGVAIQVSLIQDPHNPQQAVLEVADNGILPEGGEALNNPGLGMELISALSDQLQGSINWNTNTPGTGVRVCLRFPTSLA
ncbi:MAG: sensor histidine kinase [Spirochaetota bacterium]